VIFGTLSLETVNYLLQHAVSSGHLSTPVLTGELSQRGQERLAILRIDACIRSSQAPVRHHA